MLAVARGYDYSVVGVFAMLLKIKVLLVTGLYATFLDEWIHWVHFPLHFPRKGLYSVMISSLLEGDKLLSTADHNLKDSWTFKSVHRIFQLSFYTPGHINSCSYSSEREVFSIFIYVGKFWIFLWVIQARISVLKKNQIYRLSTRILTECLCACSTHICIRKWNHLLHSNMFGRQTDCSLTALLVLSAQKEILLYFQRQLKRSSNAFRLAFRLRGHRTRI